MIFLGDIASANEACSKIFYKSMNEMVDLFKNNSTVLNLEGLISDTCIDGNTPVINNHPSIIESLRLINTKVVSLANNHTLDLPSRFEETKDKLNANDILFLGAGKNETEAEKPCFFSDGSNTFIFFAYCWDILLIQDKANKGQLVVNKINEKKILAEIKQHRKNNPNAKIVALLHWNFDLETLPFPLHRCFSQAMIDAGADIVIGNHSHCVQGGERYKGKAIIYGLGNFFFPSNVFASGRLKFPEWAYPEMAIDWNPNTDEVKCFWFNYQKGSHCIEYKETEDFDSGERINTYSPYRKMSNNEYLTYFKKNRRKNFLLPIYKSHKNEYENKINDFCIRRRLQFARFLAQNKIKNW